MNKVLIISNEFQPDIDDVISWLLYYKIDFVRITPSTIVNISLLKINKKKIDINIIINNTEFNLRQFSASLMYQELLPNVYLNFIEKNDLIDEAFISFVDREWRSLSSFILNYIYSNLFTLGSPYSPNKLDQLLNAFEVGLNIPYTEIRNNYHNIVTFKNGLITKPIQECFLYHEKNTYYTTRTIQFSGVNHYIENNASLFPFLAQQNIKKIFDIRVFYLCGSCYSSAIFPCYLDKSVVDWRINLNNTRITSCKLPNSIERKISLLMKKLNLNMGSIDLVYSSDFKYYFLEVNPYGIFQNFSESCNYNFPKKIVEILLNHV